MEAKDQELPLTTVMDCLIQAHMGCQHWVPFARWAAEHILALSWQGYKEQLGGGGAEDSIPSGNQVLTYLMPPFLVGSQAPGLLLAGRQPLQMCIPLNEFTYAKGQYVSPARQILGRCK